MLFIKLNVIIFLHFYYSKILDITNSDLSHLFTYDIFIAFPVVHDF